MLEPNIKWRGYSSKHYCVCFLVSCDPRSEGLMMESSVFCHPSVLKWIPSLNVPATGIMNWKGSFLFTFLLWLCQNVQSGSGAQVCFFICKAVKLMEQNIKWLVKLYNNNKLVTTMTHDTLTPRQPHRRQYWWNICVLFCHKYLPFWKMNYALRKNSLFPLFPW